MAVLDIKQELIQLGLSLCDMRKRLITMLFRTPETNKFN